VFAQGTRRALIIAIEDYPAAAGLPSLYGTRNDAIAVRDALESGGYPKDNIILMTDAAEQPALRPTRQNVLNQVKVLKSRSTDKDILLVVSMTHGVVVGKTSFLCTLDTTEAAKSDPNVAGQVMLATAKFAADLSKVKARGRLLIVDACRDTDGVAKNYAEELKASLPDINILSSCGVGEKALNDPYGKGGIESNRFIFNHYLVKALEGESKLQNFGGSRLGVRELSTYVARKTSRHVKEYLKLEKLEQTPTLWSSGTDVGFDIVELDQYLPELGTTTGDPRIERVRTAGVLARQASERIGRADRRFMERFEKIVKEPGDSGTELLQDRTAQLRYILAGYVDPALELDPDSRKAHIVRGTTYRACREYGRALEHFGNASSDMDVFAKTERLVPTNVSLQSGGTPGGGRVGIPGLGGLGIPGLGGLGRRTPAPTRTAPAPAATPTTEATIALLAEANSAAAPLHHVKPGANLMVKAVVRRQDGEWLLIVKINDLAFKELDGAGEKFQKFGEDDGGWIHESQVDWFPEMAELYRPGVAVSDAFNDAVARYQGANKAIEVLSAVQGGLALGGLGGAAGWVGFAKGIVAAVRERKFRERWGAATAGYNAAVERNRRLAELIDAREIVLPEDQPVRLTALPWETAASTATPQE